MKNVLVTGGLGFIGSHFIDLLISSVNDDIRKIVCVDNLAYSANKEYMNYLSRSMAQRSDDLLHFYQADIKDTQLISNLINKFCITHVINFAAETHVDNSIVSSDAFISTNINGVHSLLQCYRENSHIVQHYLQVSTDEVFGSTYTDFFKESSPLNPSNPYAASKAAGDLLVSSYCKTYSLNCTVTNCTNNFGIRQHREKFIPNSILTGFNTGVINVYGDGNNIRDWIHVYDHCVALKRILFYKVNPQFERVCIGSQQEYTNNQIAHMIKQILIEDYGVECYINYVRDRIGHDYRYAIDSSYLEENYYYKPSIKMNREEMKKIVEYYIKNV